MAPAPGLGIRSKISRVSGWNRRVGSNLCALIDENPSDGLGDPHASDYDIGVPQFLIRVHLFLTETAGQASLSDTKPCIALHAPSSSRSWRNAETRIPAKRGSAEPGIRCFSPSRSLDLEGLAAFLLLSAFLAVHPKIM